MIKDLLRELIAIPSVNPTLAPGEGQGELAIATFAAEWLNAHGVSARVEVAAPGRANVHAEVGAGDGPTLCLCAHLDTVGTAGMTIPAFEPRVDGNRIYGRGSYDMKGGLAAVMATAASLSAAGTLRGRVTLALVADEVYASVGADDYVRRHRADACILTEPTEGQLILGHKGFVWARIRTQGRAAHGSNWAEGVSAIGKMGRVITALEMFDQEVLRQRVHPLVGPASMHCALVHGGSGISTYAQECVLEVERRTIPGEELSAVPGELLAVARAAGVEAEVSSYFSRPALLCSPDQPIVGHLVDAARKVTGALPRESGVAYWTDAAVFSSAGIPTVIYGPAGEGAHAAVEWVDLDSVESVARVLTKTAWSFCKP